MTWDAAALPSARDEAWRYTAPQRLVDDLRAGAALPEVAADLHADDGRWSPGARCEARRPWADGFETLFGTLASEAAAVGLSSRVAVRRCAPRAATALRLRVPAGVAVVVVRHVGSGDGLQLADIDVDVAAGARLVLVRTVEGEGRHLGRVRARVDGALELLSLVDAAGLCRVEVDATLNAGARIDLGVLVRAAAGAHVDHHVDLRHMGPATTSTQAVRGLVHDGGRSAFTGRVEVDAAAAGADARQVVRHMALGSRARVDARPWLAIRCDDVACTHGATVGRLDDDALFFLRSRGLPEAEARRMMLAAFAAELLGRLPAAARDLAGMSTWD